MLSRMTTTSGGGGCKDLQSLCARSRMKCDDKRMKCEFRPSTRKCYVIMRCVGGEGEWFIYVWEHVGAPTGQPRNEVRLTLLGSVWRMAELKFRRNCNGVEGVGGFAG